MAYALDGLRVLDLSRVLAGPWATQLLGDLGAEIIKIEHPVRGDDTRSWGPPFQFGEDGDTREASYFLSANRNKKSVCVDISTEAGQSVIRELSASSDVLVENFKTGTLEKYSQTYQPPSYLLFHNRLWPDGPLCRPARIRPVDSGNGRSDERHGRSR